MGWRSSPKRRTVVATRIGIAVVARDVWMSEVTPEAIALLVVLVETVVTVVVIVSCSRLIISCLYSYSHPNQICFYFRYVHNQQVMAAEVSTCAVMDAVCSVLSLRWRWIK